MINIIDTRDDFKTFIDNFDESEPCKAYRKHYFEKNQKILEGLAMTHIKEGVEGIESTLADLDLSWYKEQYHKLMKLDFVESTRFILEKAAKELADDLEYDIDCYLVFGYKTMSGCSTYVDNKNVIAIGLEHIADYKDERKYEDLIVHELHHVIRGMNKAVLEEAFGENLKSIQITREIAEQIVMNTKLKHCFIDEGLAVVAPAMVKEEEISDERLMQLLFYDEKHFKCIMEQEDELMDMLVKDFESNNQDDIYKWTFGMTGSIVNGIPARSLYYLGAKFIMSIIEKGTFTFKEMTRMRADQILAGSNEI